MKIITLLLASVIAFMFYALGWYSYEKRFEKEINKAWIIYASRKYVEVQDEEEKNT